MEVVLYWIDGFKRYWSSATKIFDFFITFMCFIPIICKIHLDSMLATAYSEAVDTIKNQCPYLVFDDRHVVDLSNAAGSNPWPESLLFTVYHSYKQLQNGQSTPFMGTERDRFCNFARLENSALKMSSAYSYFCNYSEADYMSIWIYFGLPSIQALRVLRFLKLTFSRRNVQDIAAAIVKAMRSLNLIMSLCLIFILLGSLMIYTLFSENGSVEYTEEQFKQWMQDGTISTERGGFGGFISIAWTFAILFQMMTLDRWKSIIGQVYYDHFIEGKEEDESTPKTSCDLFPPNLQWQWFKDGEWSNLMMYTLIFLLLFGWFWMGCLVFKNLITSVIVNNYLQYSNEIRWGENEANVERELKNIAEEIEEEVKRVELIPNTTDNVSTDSSVESYLTEDEDDIQLIDQLEKQSEFWRENWYKPWRYPSVQRLFPSLSNKIDKFTGRVAKVGDDNVAPLSPSSSDETRESFMKRFTGKDGGQNLKPGNEAENIQRLSTHVMDQKNLNINTPNANLLRRGSAISMANELQMNNVAGKLHQYRKQSTANFSDDYTSSDSESDIEENHNRRLSGQSSIFSMFSRKSERRSSKETPEYDTADFDLTQWELAVQIHMDKIKGYPKESLWPRDILFRYYQLQERLQENIQERKEILDLFMQCMVNDHDS